MRLQLQNCSHHGQIIDLHCMIQVLEGLVLRTRSSALTASSVAISLEYGQQVSRFSCAVWCSNLCVCVCVFCFVLFCFLFCFVFFLAEAAVQKCQESRVSCSIGGACSQTYEGLLSSVQPSAALFIGMRCPFHAFQNNPHLRQIIDSHLMM